MLISQFDKFVNRSTQEILGSEIEQENLEPMLSTDIVRNGGNVTGVKGEKEVYYRTGNVNLTSTDIGALNEENVYNGIDKTAAGYALDARQGKALADKLDATQSDIAIIIEGNQTTHTGGVAVGEYVIVRNSTISGIDDGMYKATQAIPANTAIDSTYLSAVDGGGMNEIKVTPDYINSIDFKPNTNQLVSYTAPSNGYIIANARLNSQYVGFRFLIMNPNYPDDTSNAFVNFYYHPAFFGTQKICGMNIIPVSKGDVFQFKSESYDSSILTIEKLIFVPTKV